MTCENVCGAGSEGKSPTVPETIYINVFDPRVGVIAYYAVLAYPRRDEVSKRRAFELAVVATWMKEFASKLSRKSVPAFYTGFKNEKIYGALRLGLKRLAKRLSAGQVGWNIVLTGRYEADTPDGKRELLIRGASTIQKAIQCYVQSMGKPIALGDQDAVKNATHRVWAESLAVLHLAMTNPVTIKIVEALLNGEKLAAPKPIDQDLLDSIYDPSWLRDALGSAEELRLTLERWLGTDLHDPLGRGFKSESAIRLLPMLYRLEQPARQ